MPTKTKVAFAGHAGVPTEPQEPPMSITDRIPRKRSASASTTPAPLIRTATVALAFLTVTRESLRGRDTCFQRVGERFPDRFELDPVEDVLEEAADDQPLGFALRESARHQVEKLLAVDLAERRAVGAAHVVGEDLEAGDRV